MPFTVFEIDAAKPGLRPVKQRKKGEKDIPSKDEVSVNRATFLAERQLMMQVWADYLDTLKTEKVVPMMKPKPITDLKAIMVPGYM